MLKTTQMISTLRHRTATRRFTRLIDSWSEKLCRGRLSTEARSRTPKHLRNSSEWLQPKKATKATTTSTLVQANLMKLTKDVKPTNCPRQLLIKGEKNSLRAINWLPRSKNEWCLPKSQRKKLQKSWTQGTKVQLTNDANVGTKNTYETFWTHIFLTTKGRQARKAQVNNFTNELKSLRMGRHADS